MNRIQDSSYREPAAALRPSNKKTRTVIYFIAVSLMSISLLLSACSFIGLSKPPATQTTPPSGNKTFSGSTQTSPSTPAVNTPATTPITPTPAPPAQPPAQAPAASQTPSTPAVQTTPPPSNTQTMIKKEACLMSITKDDLGQGWMQLAIGAAPLLYTNSTCHVSWTQGGPYSPTVQNTVAVYRTVDVAINAFENEKPQDVKLSYPSIGDECFLNDTAPINKLLVFRKANVVEWIWLQQDKTGDILQYAKMVEPKVTP